ncbi:uncharacterized protein LOC123258643 [Cotesia glomerata]|nr:uncharacterized protein LOC123258643 [Cotesia glomerata]
MMLTKVMNLENNLKNCVEIHEWSVIKTKLDEFEVQISKISSSVEKVNKLFSSTDGNLINAGLYERIKKLENNIESQDKQMRMRNIIIKGLKKGNSGTREEVAEMLKKELFVEPEIEECRVIREGSNSTDRIIMVKLKNYEDKRIIMTRRVLLKGKNFIIHDDLTRNERQAQFFIRERAREERIKGAFVKVFRGKLFVNGECWVYAQNYVNADNYRFIRPVKETAV